MARLRDSFLAGEFPDLKKKANHGFGPEPSSWPCESHRCDEGATLLAFTFLGCSSKETATTTTTMMMMICFITLILLLPSNYSNVSVSRVVNQWDCRTELVSTS
mmetsp:Transcript_4233/g.8651  ORF Transcript_4233/g.8651 Transcript_4233/m.8651 type:complete len:104 (+) Transcript_4233:109-420(+)